MITNNNTLGYDPWKGNPIGRQVAENNAIQMQQFQQSLQDYAKRQNEYINASNNWKYRDIEGDYPIATNVWANNSRIPIYKIPGSAMLKAFPDYTWNNGQTFDPNINYYTIRNAKGQYALVPQGSYISELMDQSFERDKALHPTNIAASDMTAQVANVPTQYGIKRMPPKQPEKQETTQQTQLWQDNRSNWERQQAQNMYDLNAWQQRYNYWQNIENTTRDKITRPFILTNYVRGGLDAINGYDSFLGSFFDPNKHGMWVGPEGLAFQQNHPLVSGLLDLGVDVLGPKFIPKIGKSLRPITFKPTSLTNDSYNLSTLADRFKNSNWYNFYFGNKKPITITITEPGSNPITTRINNNWLVKDKVRRASSLLRYKKPGTTLTIDGLPGSMEVIEIPQQAMNMAKKTLLPRVKISNPNDYSRSSYMMDKMKKVVAIDKELLKASSNGSIDGFATVDPKLPNYFPIGAVKGNAGAISFFTWIHELRHKLQHMIKLSLEQKNLLEKAYEGIPKGERASVNAELRSNLLKGMGDMPVEYQNLLLDQYAKNPEVVLDKLEFLNGYGQNYVQNIYKLKNSKDLTQIVQNMIDAMKYVPLVENQDKVFEKLPKGTVNYQKKD